MAKSTIKTFNIVQEKSGSKSVPSGTVTALDTVDVPDTDAYYLIIGSVQPSVTVANQNLFCRLVNGIVGGEFRNAVAVQSVILNKGNGSHVTLTCSHTTGSTQTINYMLKAIKLT